MVKKFIFLRFRLSKMRGYCYGSGIELVVRNTSARPKDPAVPRGRDAHPAVVQAVDRVSTGSTVPRGVYPAWMDDSVNVGGSLSVR